ncbi:hypothetical protein [Xanthomonas arboricola]|uniref:hypothetical protein n=1 Tax=Xanthomonas arboricola TaxID=56448 RepID=UPI000A9E1848|nr:hypothetical protein [Xanthomonas arboricola]
MTLVEFIHPLKGSSNRDLCLAAMYFHQRYDGVDELAIEAVRALLKKARVPKAGTMNIADVLSKSAPLVDAAGKQGRSILWRLTSSGQERVRQLLELPEHDIEVEHDVASLQVLVDQVADDDTVDYLREALKCLQVNALRATVVFVWSASVKKLRDDIFACGASLVDAAVRKYDTKAKTITKSDDLVLIKESVLLLAAQELGIFDKNQRGVLEECLNLRNKCGHPGKYKLGPKKVSSFLEDLIGILFK